MEKLISVIVPIYKVEAYLNKCLDSIVEQTYKNLEIILVDDGSPDGCGKICDEYAKKDKRIKVIHKANGGLSSARNAGIDVAKGEYFAFIDSDDWVAPNYIEAMLNEAIKIDADIVCCSVNYIGEDGKKIDNMPVAKTDMIIEGTQQIFDTYYRSSLSPILTYAWNKLYSRKVFKQIRYPESYVFEDVGTVLNILFECKKFSLLNLPLYNYLIRSNSIMKSTYNENKINSKAFLFDTRIDFLDKKGLHEYLKTEAEIRFNDLGSTFRQTTDKNLRKKIKSIFKEKWKKYSKYLGFNKQSIKARLKRIYVQIAR